jgi:hypothetical protein
MNTGQLQEFSGKGRLWWCKEFAGAVTRLLAAEIIHHGDTEATEPWFLRSFLRDLRASVVY